MIWVSRYISLAIFLCPLIAHPAFAEAQNPPQEEEISDNDLLNAVRAGKPQGVDTRAAIVRMLIEVKEGTMDPETFYKNVSQLDIPAGQELRHTLMEVKKDIGNYLGEEGLKEVFGDVYAAGGSEVEAKILTHRKEVVMATIKQAIEVYAKTNPQFSFYYGEVGGWPKEKMEELKFAGDIDFNFLSGDLDSAMALKKIFDDLIKARYGRTPEELDIPCTVHGMATAEVYVGKHGQAFAEAVTEKLWPINFDETKGPIGVVAREKSVDFKEALRQMVMEAQVNKSANALDDLATLKWPDQPGISLEMIRHFEHDIVGKNVYTDLESFVKAAKYADRSFTFLAKDLGEGAIKDKLLRQLTADLTEHKKDPKKQVDLIKAYYEASGKSLPFEVDLSVNAEGKSIATIKANEALIRGFWDLCRQTMWESANFKIKKVITDMNQKISALADTDAQGAKAIYDELSKYHEMLEIEDMILRDDKAGVHEHLDPEFQKVIVDFRQTVATFKQKIAKNGLIKYLDPQLAKTYKWVDEMLKAGKEFNIEMARAAIMAFPGKVNDVLDFMDDGMLTKLRTGEGDEYIKILRKGRGYYWSEQADMFLKGTPLEGRFTQRLDQMETEYSAQLQKISTWLNSHLEGKLASRGLAGIQAINNSFNQSVASSTTGQRMMTGMMLYSLKDELPLYYNLMEQGDYNGLAGEFFKRRVPFGGAVERGVMGDYYGVAWEVTSTLIPPAALFSAAASVGEYVAQTAFEAYFDEELEIFIDNLYEGAKFKIANVEKVGEDLKVGSWELISVSYNSKEYVYNELIQLETEGAREMSACLKQPSDQRSGCFPMEKMGDGLFEWWRNADAFTHQFRKSDPFIQMVSEMEKDPLVGPKLKDHFLYQKWARLEQIKVDFLKRTKVKLEERRSGEQTLLSGKFLEMYDELLRIAEELDIRVQLEEVIDEEFGGEIVQFLTWMKDYIRGTIREVRGDVDVWDVYEELSAFVTKNLAAYNKIYEGRAEAEKQLTLNREDQGLRLLTGPYFLQGRSSEDEASSGKWIQLPTAVKDAMTAKLSTIKKEAKAQPAELDLNDESYDRKMLDQLIYHDSFREMWKKVNSSFTDVKIPSFLGKSPAKQTQPNDEGVMSDQDRALERFALHAKRIEEILEEFRKHYGSQAGEETEGEGEEASANNLAALKEQIDGLPAQVIADEIAALEDTFNDELKSLSRTLENISKELMNIARDLSSLESLAGQMDAKNAQAQKAAGDAYNSAEKCAMARGEIEDLALGVCQLAQTIKATDNIAQLDQLIAQLRNESSKVSVQEDIFKRELANARAASRLADEILKEMTSLRSKREETKADLSQQEARLAEIPPAMSRLESHLASMQGKLTQMNGIVGEASGILAQAQQFNPDELSKDDKKIVKQIESAFGRITKFESSTIKVYERNQTKLNTPKDKLTNLQESLAQAKSRQESLMSLQINDAAIAEIQKYANEATASYDAAEIFEDPLQQAVGNSETCAREAERMHERKTSPEAQVAQHDCSQWPGTVAKWNSANKAPHCVCTEGNLWDENLNSCVSEEQYYTSRTDCSNYGANVHVAWDGRQALCFCNDGYEWTSDRRGCRVAAHIQVAQTNCSAYPGTIAQWDASIDGVRCNCQGGNYWDGSRCIAQPQGGTGGGPDLGQLIGGMLDTYNQGTGGTGGGGSATTGGNTWGGQQQAQGDPCETNFSFGSDFLMRCGCNGYTYATSQNKCVPGGGGSSNNTGSGWTNTGYQGGGGGGGGSNSSGVDTSNPSGGSGGGGYSICCANGSHVFLGQDFCLDGSEPVHPCRD